MLFWLITPLLTGTEDLESPCRIHLSTFGMTLEDDQKRLLCYPTTLPLLTIYTLCIDFPDSSCPRNTFSYGFHKHARLSALLPPKSNFCASPRRLPLYETFKPIYCHLIPLNFEKFCHPWSLRQAIPDQWSAETQLAFFAFSSDFSSNS